ncbi:MAG: ABC transporter permease [Candidatus Acidiferrum sp.]
MRNWLHKTWLRLRAFLKRRQLDHDLEDEVAFHLSMREQKNRAAGFDAQEARYAARRQFGNFTLTKERTRDMWTFTSMEDVLRDVRFGSRVLVKNPAFTLVAILTLALGIGANTAIFSVVYAALLRPLPYLQPAQLITLGEIRPQQQSQDLLTSNSWNASYPDYVDWSHQSKAFQSLAGFSGDGFIYRGSGEPQLITAAESTTNFFSTLGVRPFLGRDFLPGEDIASGPKVAILTYGFWISNFAGDPSVIGRSIRLDANSVTIIGVLSRDFEFAPQGNAQLWVPMHLGPDSATRRNLRWMPVIGRLAPGVTLLQARTEMNSISSALAAAFPQANGSIQIVLFPLRDRIVGRVQSLLLVLFGAVGFVLLISCANVANLLMVRAASRRKEFAVRSALGAGRGRLISQLLAESMMLSASGAALGLVFAHWGTSLLIAAIPQPLLDSAPFFRDAHENPAVLAFLCGVAIFTGLAFGLSPALQMSQSSAGEALKEDSRASASGSRTRLRNAFVVAEIAFCLVLLVGAGLMVKSLSVLLHRNPGFDYNNVVTFAVNLPDTSYPKDPDVLRFDHQFTELAAALPGLAGIASNSTVPLTGGGNTIRFLLEGQSIAAGQESECDIRDITANYFSVMKIPLISGRFFNDSDDTADGPKHIVVTQSFVERYLHGENPLGKRLRFTYSDKQPYREIVGVVGDVADSGLDSPPEPSLFAPFLQTADSYISYVVRASTNPATTVASLRAALHDVDPQLVLLQPQTLEELIDQSPSVFLRRYPSYLIGSFAALALLLAMIGLYGLVSYSVAQRTRELGVRMALGASQADVLRLVLREGVRLAFFGISIGLVAALAFAQLMRALLFGVNPADPTILIGVALVLGVVALAACFIPAHRATRVDPMIALRYE